MVTYDAIPRCQMSFVRSCQKLVTFAMKLNKTFYDIAPPVRRDTSSAVQYPTCCPLDWLFASIRRQIAVIRPFIDLGCRCTAQFSPFPSILQDRITASNGSVKTVQNHQHSRLILLHSHLPILLTFHPSQTTLPWPLTSPTTGRPSHRASLTVKFDFVLLRCPLIYNCHRGYWFRGKNEVLYFSSFFFCLLFYFHRRWHVTKVPNCHF
jgi:hypothetical protein